MKWIYKTDEVTKPYLDQIIRDVNDQDGEVISVQDTGRMVPGSYRENLYLICWKIPDYRSEL